MPGIVYMLTLCWWDMIVDLWLPGCVVSVYGLLVSSSESVAVRIPSELVLITYTLTSTNSMPSKWVVMTLCLAYFLTLISHKYNWAMMTLCLIYGEFPLLVQWWLCVSHFISSVNCGLVSSGDSMSHLLLHFLELLGVDWGDKYSLK